MRSDVLDVMADEILAHPVGAHASFVTWEGGRPRLDGMAKGRHWEIDREQRAWEKANAAELAKYQARLNWKKWATANPERYAAAQKRWASENREHLRAVKRRHRQEHRDLYREWKRRSEKKVKADPARLALRKARNVRYREKRYAAARERYWADLEAGRARALESYRRNREAVLARNSQKAQAARRLKAGTLPPCPVCGGVVALTPIGRIPKYCSERCSHNAARAAYSARQKAKRRAT